MQKLMNALFAVIVAASMIGFIAIAGTLFGALTGWIAGLFFAESLQLLSEVLGVDATPLQLGAIFGFVGAFFRQSISTK